MGEMADLFIDNWLDDEEYDPNDGPYYPIRILPKEGDKCSCGGEYVMRTNRKTGVQFLGCSKFPDCKKSSPLGRR